MKRYRSTVAMRALTLVLGCSLFLAVGRLTADTAPRSLMEIVLEKKTNDAAQTVSPGHVFEPGDILRFRLKPEVDGYLYVMDQNTSGKYVVLFPRPETGSDNRIQHGREYMLPATQDGWFEVSGPAGHEKLYFLLSPVALSTGEAQEKAVNPNAGIPQGTAPPTMRPRCNDGIFKVRGECVDSQAGPKPVEKSADLPVPVQDMAGKGAVGASRDLKFTKKQSSSNVAATGPLSAPVVYEYLLAHN